MASKDGGEGTTPRRHSLNDECDPNSVADEKRLVAKLDFYIIPLVMVLYLFSFLDRFVRKLVEKKSQ
jgi:hypothetical protein